jgi:hypothetical protein
MKEEEFVEYWIKKQKTCSSDVILPAKREFQTFEFYRTKRQQRQMAECMQRQDLLYAGIASAISYSRFWAC